jgi:hypothetical protein
MTIASDLIKYTRLVFGLRGFLRSTVSLEESKQVIAARLSDRGKNFLSLVRKGIYQYPRSPYFKLLRSAGVEFGDIEAQVEKEGIETTLHILYNKGVYLSYEEFKRGKEVLRGSSHFQFKERDFDNPLLPNYYQTLSSGSRSAGTRTSFDFNHFADMSYYRHIMLAANNTFQYPLGVWKPVLPAVSGTHNVLSHWKIGKPVARWFSPVDEKRAHTPFHHRLAMRYILYGSRIWGAKLARPEYVGLEEAVKVARWMADSRTQYGGCSLICSVSPAVKVCQAALNNGLDITGTHFTVSGEPLTPAKRRLIEQAGAIVSPRYNISEIGMVGCGCPGKDDSVHLLCDSMALIQHQRKVEQVDTDVNAFLFTPLLPSTPKILLNVESDDYGRVETGNCDCLFGQLGFKTRLKDIRSYTKLTGAGMTIMGTDLVRVIEEVLPGKYGGAATDYQLLEEEDNQGQTRLSIIISPTVGAVDEQAVIDTLLDELRRMPHPGKLTAALWSQGKMLQVKRIHPLSKNGKVMTLHLQKEA